MLEVESEGQATGQLQQIPAARQPKWSFDGSDRRLPVVTIIPICSTVMSTRDRAINTLKGCNR